MTKEQEIQNYMTKLEISREEAEELWNDDHSEEVLPEVAEMEKKAKALRRYEKSDKERKKTVKERKIDEDKKFFIDGLAEWLKSTSVQNISVKNEAEISFNDNEISYTLKLIKHRPPKK